MVGYNVQSAVDIKHHLIAAHEVTNLGTDRAQLSQMANKTKAALKTDALDIVADRGYFSSAEILACEEAGIMVTLPKPLTSGNKIKGRFVEQDFRYVPEPATVGPAFTRPPNLGFAPSKPGFKGARRHAFSVMQLPKFVTSIVPNFGSVAPVCLAVPPILSADQ